MTNKKLTSLTTEAESRTNNSDSTYSRPLEQRLLSCISEEIVSIPSEESVDPGRCVIFNANICIIALTSFNSYKYISNFAG